MGTRLLGVINLVNEQDLIQELTEERCAASVPFAGKYHLIDFVFSNMINSGIKNIGILVLDKYQPLIEHLGQEELILFPRIEEKGLEKIGDIEILANHLDYFNKSKQEYVVISGSTQIINLDYRNMLEFHIQEEADITLLYKTGVVAKENLPARFIEMSEDNRIYGISDVFTDIQRHDMLLDTFIIKKELLMEIIKIGMHDGKKDLLGDLIIPQLGHYKIIGYPIHTYLANLNSLSNYYRHSMNLLNLKNQEFFFRDHEIYTKNHNEPPTKYLARAEVKNSLLSNGCLIDGRVENSILFRGVKVGRGAVIKNSILMQNCEIGQGAVIENAILDKEVMWILGKEIAR